MTVDVVVDEVTSVGAPISPVELALSRLLAIEIRALIVGVIRPYFLTVAVLLVLEPVAFVLCSVSVVVSAKTMGFIVLPVAIVDVAVCVD
jgi:hypothetical protein